MPSLSVRNYKNTTTDAGLYKIIMQKGKSLRIVHINIISAVKPHLVATSSISPPCHNGPGSKYS